MFKKTRPIPLELVILRIMSDRKNLSDKEKLQLSNLEKGYEGEVMFDSLIQDLDTLVINDLLLEMGDTLFQIDTLIIFNERVYLIDVKYYEGEYCYDAGIFKTITGIERKDPMLQLNRCHSSLRQLLQKYGFNYPIDAFLVFVNPDFTLFQPTQNPQIILPTQVNSFIKKLNKKVSKLNDKHEKLADLLVTLHKTENPYVRLPAYSYEMLQKGMKCGACRSFAVSVSRTIITCESCGCEERVEAAVLRSVEELGILFPGIRITTNLVHDWCKVIASTKTIRRILKKNFKAIGKTKESYYE
ncbi:nuclease-related domain-containing protein [Neobacillus niacini]|uniref:nuclease-related domain-containing protein n=1 Tax=Neobacillus niacini TaxID=86668 RepID=UPI0039838E37